MEAVKNEKYDVGFTLNINDKNDVSNYFFDDELAKEMGNFDKEQSAPLSSKKASYSSQNKLSTPEERRAYFKNSKGLNLSGL
ncbi:lipoprotein [Listeria floridensis FSL S10-1187]|uniref:Lipoprotein n=1 Tax=Listeria floridensis FSL S10-1187 TaxID=1265817 RepID=A0ABN0RG14_9LIST|nr:hypothetical protein [Listeria floridensis]EUJ32437.1 lipoprotein [Listeria floridensis FSL S10-1187]